MQENPRRVSRLVAIYNLPSKCSPAQRELLEKTARESPARQSLHPQIDVQFVFNYDL
jgi:hypothetical protein